MNSKIIAVDFDGTLCENKWPEIGKPHTDVIEYVKKRKNAGDKLILWTNRVEDKLDAAVQWCREQGIVFDAKDAFFREYCLYHSKRSKGEDRE